MGRPVTPRAAPVSPALHEGRRMTRLFVPCAAPETGLLSHSILDLGHGLWPLSHVFSDDGRARIASEDSRLVDPDDLDAWARDAGLRPEASNGDRSGAPATGVEPMLISTYSR